MLKKNALFLADGFPYPVTFIVLLLGLQAFDTGVKIVPHVSLLGGRVVWRQP